jgi:two-component system LytT family response regulator
MREVNTLTTASSRKKIESFKTRIKLVSANKINIISKSDILYLKSDSNYCEVILIDGSKMVCSQTLKSIVEKLKSPHFFRPHQSFVFNMNYLKSVNIKMNELEMESGVFIPISRSNRNLLRQRLEVCFD